MHEHTFSIYTLYIIMQLTLGLQLIGYKVVRF